MKLKIRHAISLLAAATCVAGDVPPKPTPSQESGPFPPGLVAFFSGPSCPDGWTDEPLAAGRIVVAGATANESGVATGEPFVGNETPKHDHAFTASRNLPVAAMPTLEFCCFTKNWIEPQRFEVEGRAAAQDTALPFYAIRTCRREAQQP